MNTYKLCVMSAIYVKNPLAILEVAPWESTNQALTFVCLWCSFFLLALYLWDKDAGWAGYSV